MSTVVTGAAGFIGSHVAHALLDRGESVLGIDNLNDYYSPALKQSRLERLVSRPGFQFLRLDFSDNAALEGALSDKIAAVDAIVHLGAQAGVRYSIDHPHAYLHSNYAGHLNILELARRLPKLRHLVYASSSSVYGASQRIPFALDDPADEPTSLYAASKRANELMSQSYAGLYKIPQTGLRFFTVYGPWGRPDMAYYRFVSDAFQGLASPVYGDGSQQRDFTYIDDIVAGILAALDRPPRGQRPHRIFNLGNDRPNTLNRMIELIEAECGRAVKRNILPVQPADVPATWADISQTKKELGFEPLVPLEEGIRRFVDWYRGYQNP